MKKVIKSVALIAVIAIAVAFLAGCGNKLVATKSGDEGKETVEVKFKNDKVSEVKMTYEFNDDDTADLYYSMMGGDLTEALEGVDVKKDGKKVTITMDGKAFADFSGASSEMSKDDVRKSLEDSGYTVK